MKFPNAFWHGIMAGLARARGGLLGGALGRPAAAAADLCHDCRALLRTRGEASVVTLARGALDTFARLDAGERHKFFDYLARDLGPDPEVLDAAITAYRDAPGPETAAALARAAESPRRELLGLLNTAPNGMPDLLAMRESLLDALPDQQALQPLDDDFLYLLRAWFNRGFLELRRIDWRTPAFVLEKLIDYEAVHEILNWEDLQRRLAADRRCFGFFHPSLPDEPLIFVQVALCRGLASSVHDLIFGEVENDPEADTAVFYSISNCQRGLQGISFGDFLIKQVVHELAAETPPVAQVRHPVAHSRIPCVAGARIPRRTAARRQRHGGHREPGPAGRPGDWR